MTDQDDAALAAGRLEQALERIAALSVRQPAAASPSSDVPAADRDTEAVAARLDVLIARLRSVLGPESGV